MHKGIPADIRWLIEAKVRITGEFSDALVSYMPGLGKSSYAKKEEQKGYESAINVQDGPVTQNADQLEWRL